MSETNVEKRIVTLEAESKSFHRYMNFVNGAAAVLVILVSVVGGIVLTKFLGVMEKSAVLEATTARNEQLAELKASLAHQGRDIDRLDMVVHDLVRSNQSKGMSTTYAESGKIVSVTKDKIVLLREEGANAQIQYTLALSPDVKVRSKGQPAKLEDLKPGMFVSVVRGDDDKVTSIEILPSL
jgi:hypothetical protein